MKLLFKFIKKIVNSFRTKKLTKKDIKDCGWLFIENKNNVLYHPEGTWYFVQEKNRLYHLFYDTLTSKIKIYNHSSKINVSGIKIENKSELIKLIEQSGI